MCARFNRRARRRCLHEAPACLRTAKQCFAAVRTAGQVIFNGELPAVELSPAKISSGATYGYRLWFYHFNEYPAMLELFATACGRIFITHTLPIGASDDAFAMMEGKSGKVLLEYEK
jgi:hypothetical protein